MPVTAQIAVNSVPGSNDDVLLASTVTLSNVNDTGVTTWEWTILSQPTEGVGALATLSPSTTASVVTFTPRREGSYLLRLVVNKGLVDEASDIVVVAVRELETGNRIPAIMETTENDASTGWAGTAVNDILRRVTRLTDGGTYVAIADENLTPGDVVHMNGMVTIANGLPGERQIPTVMKALATSQANVDGPLGVMVGNKAGERLAVSDGDYCRVMMIGALPSFVLTTGGAAGDLVYVDDTGNLSLTPGTYIRQIGDIAGVVVDGTYDLSIAAVSTSIPRGNAGGDLSGAFPNPTVAKINGTTVTTAGGALVSGLPLLATGTSTAAFGPLDLSNTNVTLSGAPLPATRGGTNNVGVPAAGVLLYGNGVGYTQLAAGTSSQVLRGGTTPTWGYVPTGAYLQGSIPYESLQSTSGASITSGTFVVSTASYSAFATRTLSVKLGGMLFTIMPKDDGTEHWNRVVTTANGVQADIYLQFVVSGVSGTKTYEQRFSMPPSPSGTNVMGSITFPTLPFYVTASGNHTVTASAKLAAGVVGSATWQISDYQLVVWQG